MGQEMVWAVCPEPTTGQSVCEISISAHQLDKGELMCPQFPRVTSASSFWSCLGQAVGQRWGEVTLNPDCGCPPGAPSPATGREWAQCPRG